MELLDADRVRALLRPAALVEGLRDAFAAEDVTVPERVHHTLDAGRETTLLVMPAWRTDRWLGVKIVTHHPDNGRHGLPAIRGAYLLADAATGEPLAVLDGAELTRWRTAAASALAADHLAPRTVGEHLLVGAGNVASAMPACYAAVRDVGLTRVWARSSARARTLVARLRDQGVDAEVETDLRAGVRRADVVSCATSATTPLVLAEDVRPGTHVDLVGAFTPQMVEADERLVTSASLFVDVAAALHEPGDLVGPLSRGTLRPEDVRATLADLAAGRHTGRSAADEVTVFKSVGTALEDLVAATVVWQAGR
jgi:ornithine cyclodeaminase